MASLNSLVQTTDTNIFNIESSNSDKNTKGISDDFFNILNSATASFNNSQLNDEAFNSTTNYENNTQDFDNFDTQTYNKSDNYYSSENYLAYQQDTSLNQYYNNYNAYSNENNYSKHKEDINKQDLDKLKESDKESNDIFDERSNQQNDANTIKEEDQVQSKQSNEQNNIENENNKVSQDKNNQTNAEAVNNNSATAQQINESNKNASKETTQKQQAMTSINNENNQKAGNKAQDVENKKLFNENESLKSSILNNSDNKKENNKIKSDEPIKSEEPAKSQDKNNVKNNAENKDNTHQQVKDSAKNNEPAVLKNAAEENKQQVKSEKQAQEQNLTFDQNLKKVSAQQQQNVKANINDQQQGNNNLNNLKSTKKAKSAKAEKIKNINQQEFKNIAQSQENQQKQNVENNKLEASQLKLGEKAGIKQIININNNANSQVNLNELASSQQTNAAIKTSFDKMLNSQNIKNPAEDSVIDQVIKKSTVEFQNGKTKISLQLNPENLGKVEINLVSEKGTITAKIMAENNQVKDMLSKNLEALRQNLSQQGINLNKITVQTQESNLANNNNQNNNEEFKRSNEANTYDNEESGLFSKESEDSGGQPGLKGKYSKYYSNDEEKDLSQEIENSDNKAMEKSSGYTKSLVDYVV